MTTLWHIWGRLAMRCNKALKCSSNGRKRNKFSQLQFALHWRPKINKYTTLIHDSNATLFSLVRYLHIPLTFLVCLTKYLTEATWGRRALFGVEVQAVMVGSLYDRNWRQLVLVIWRPQLGSRRSKMSVLSSLTHFYAVWDSSPWTDSTHISVPMEVGRGDDVTWNCSGRPLWVAGHGCREVGSSLRAGILCWGVLGFGLGQQAWP